MKVTTIIAVEIEVDEKEARAGRAEADVCYVVDNVLDAGALQDAINNHALDARPMRVVSAMQRWGLRSVKP